MRIGVVSDTHGELSATQRAIRVFESLEVDLLIHCGDIGTPEVIELLADWPCHFVFGNMDNAGMLRGAIGACGSTCYERFGHLKLQGRSIAFLHGDDESLLQQTIQSGRWDLVCHGHTHVAANSFTGPTLVVNPGAIQRTGSPSVAMVELPSLEVSQLHL